MESYLEFVDVKMETLRGLSKTIRDTPLNVSTKQSHCEYRKHYVDILQSIGKVLSLCQEEITQQTERINRHIDELRAVKM